MFVSLASNNDQLPVRDEWTRSSTTLRNAVIVKEECGLTKGICEKSTWDYKFSLSIIDTAIDISKYVTSEKSKCSIHATLLIIHNLHVCILYVLTHVFRYEYVCMFAVWACKWMYTQTYMCIYPCVCIHIRM